MYLKNIKLTNFRNYSGLNFSFESPTTLLIGDNAQGKSNFLESIVFLATSKSFKADQDIELIKDGEEVLRVEGVLDDKTKLEVVMQKEEGLIKKRVKVNGVARRLIDYSQNLAIVLFSPEDINLVVGAPSLRRDHIDSVLSQVDKKYKKTLSSYENVLVRKNRVLKAIREGAASVDQLTFWTDQQILLGALVSEERRKFFSFLNSSEKQFGEFQYEYLENVLSKERLSNYQEQEIDAATSLIGPHRDDFRFLAPSSAIPSGERDLSKFGSRGEQRTSVLDLKLLEVNFMESMLGKRPLLLLDDIFSELDHEHSEHVIKISKLQQTIITAVELDSHIKKLLKEAKIYSVESGRIALIADK